MLLVDARDQDVNVARTIQQLRTRPKPLPSKILYILIDVRVVSRNLVGVGILVRIDVNTT
jgi:hypothetical protein